MTLLVEVMHFYKGKGRGLELWGAVLKKYEGGCAVENLYGPRP